MRKEQEQEQAQRQPKTAAAASVRPAVDLKRGLTAAEVKQRVDAGQVNALPEGNTPSLSEIIRKHTFTLFNLINLVLAAAIIFVGSPRNALFFGVAIINSLMGIAQELRAKKTLDELSVLSRGKVTALREGQQVELELEEIVLDDLLYLKSGNQIYADGIVISAEGMEVDESLLTGEADRIKKQTGDTLLSGSFLTAGGGFMQVTAVGADSYANALTAEAQKAKRPTTPLMRVLNTIIKVLTIAIVPLGVLLFYRQYLSTGLLQQSVLGTAASMIGMIPEGLILLTTVTLTVGAMRLAKKKALVQSLHSIETLARIDVLCLDKTGTITDGTLTLESLEPCEMTEDIMRLAVRELMHALHDENPTATALRAEFPGKQAWQASVTVPFSSARKWSGATFEGRGTYVLGAPSFVLPPSEQVALEDTIRQHAENGMRVLALAHSTSPLQNDLLPLGITCAGLIILSDTVRPEAPDTFRYFADEGVTLKVISGDDPVAVSAIATRAGIDNAQHYVDMSQWEEDGDFRHLVSQYTVFGRVSPAQKKYLVAALKNQGHTVCMTGDGVNDVLAMKEADCSVAMVSGSDAARGASEFVLMTGDFSSMIEVLKEGRRVINNIENVACLYLVKTIYSVLLSLLYSFIPFPYPFSPVQMQPVNSLTVGVSTCVLALRPNFKKPEARFLANVLENSLPAALCVVANALIIQLAAVWFDIPHAETSSMTVLLTGFIGFIVLYKIARSGKIWMKLFVGALVVAFVLCFTGFSMPVFGPLNEFFMLEGIWSRNAFFWLPLMALSLVMFQYLNRVIVQAMDQYTKMRGGKKRMRKAKYQD